jgi:hypothetical protein
MPGMDAPDNKETPKTESTSTSFDVGGLMSPSHVADNIIKNQGFGKGTDRDLADYAFGRSMEEALKSGNEADRKFVNQVNEELSKRHSNLHVDESTSGGGGRGGSKDNYEEHAEATSRFVVGNSSGKALDGLKIEVSTDKVVENGKVVGERSEINSETGGAGGGWGKQPHSFKLHDMTLEDDTDTGKGGGKGGGGKGHSG